MGETVSGRFDSLEEARRAMARLEREGVASATMTARAVDAGHVPQPEGLRGVSDRGGGAGEAMLDVRVREPQAAERAHQLLQAAGAHDIHVTSTASGTVPAAKGHGSLDAAGSSFGMAIADAATAPMKGVSASRTQHPTGSDGSDGSAGPDRK